ncbi:MAG: DnaB-like helicase C-terminal domain-containing protein [Candidatus Tectomicrobia bacterium]
MHPYHLQNEFIDPSAERALLAALMRTPSLYFELSDVLAPEVFAVETDAWHTLTQAIETGHTLSISHTWSPTSTPQETAQHLTALYQRRLLAAAQERLAAALFDNTIPPAALAALLEEEALRVQQALHTTTAGCFQWASALLPQVLDDAAARRQHWEQTGTPVQGLPTGISRLDELLNGLSEGLYLLGGAPGIGKTTLAWQIAAHVTREAPILFVTFEHTASNLILKALCAKAGLNPQEVQRGRVDLTLLQQAAATWQPMAQRVALLEGSSQLTVAHVRAQALQAMRHHKATRCLIIVDYLQLWAKVAKELQGSFQVRERVELLGGALRDVTMRLRSPVLALSSQNRSAGNYGQGKGSAALDSLKESGDLEYMADAVLFLTEASAREALPPARAVTLTVAKNRHGDVGKIDLIFRPDIGTLREEACV